MKLKIETLKDKSKKWELSVFIWVIWIMLLLFNFAFNFVAFVDWEYQIELLRFTIWVLVINAFIFIRIE